MRRLLVLILVPLALVLVACGGGADDNKKDSEDKKSQDASDKKPPKVKSAPDSPVLDKVKVTGADGAKPKVTFKKPFKVKSTAARTVTEGTGEKLENGDFVQVRYLGINGRDAKEFDSSWKQQEQDKKGKSDKLPEPITFELNTEKMIPGFVKGLVGQKVGSRVMIAIEPKDGYGSKGNPQAGIKGSDTLVFSVDVVKNIKPGKADDIKVSGKDGAKPKVSFETPWRTDKLQKKVLKKGNGPELKADQHAIVDYVGIIATDGREYDASSWKADDPTSFTLKKGAVMPGFHDGLVGQKVGSRVLLAIPPEQAYGPTGNMTVGVMPTDSVIYVVDIKAAYNLQEKAGGFTVEPPKDLPKVSTKGGFPSKISIPKGAKAPTKPVVQPLIRGEGAEVGKDDQVATIHYTGFNWRGGKLFDTSWKPRGQQSPEAKPIDLPLANYRVPGLPEAVRGQKVGSRLLVILPPADGFQKAGGLKEGGVKPTDTTVFVVDILGAG